ncbi:MAG: TrmB family transcriptional regulator [Nocardioidaceae bacterium]
MWDVVGVPEQEARIYEALVRRQHADAGTLADELSLSRHQVTRAMTHLASQGLTTRLPGRPAQFSAVAPDQAAGLLIADQERRLLELRSHAQSLAELHRRANVSWHHPADLVEVIEGGPNVARTFSRLQREAQQQIRGFDRPPYLANPVEGNPEEDEQRDTRGITYRVVYDRSALAIPGRMADIWRGIHGGEQARVGAVPMKMVLCDARAALIPAATADYTAEAAYLVHPSSLLDAVSALFEATWDRAVPLNRAPSSYEDDGKEQGAGGGVRRDDADLIGLLAGGSTDDSIARALGWSVRTVRRHVRRLMVEVGAETRFQLGMEANRRNWV